MTDYTFLHSTRKLFKQTLFIFCTKIIIYILLYLYISKPACKC